MLIKDFPNYHIFKNGSILSKGSKYNKPKFLKPSIKSNGYYSVNLYKDGKAYTRAIHRLLGEHFIPQVKDKNMIDHINMNKTDNRLCNLRWVNRGENRINTPLCSSNTTSYKNITWDKRRNKYMVVIQRDKKITRKRFNMLDEAIIFRNTNL